MKCPKCGSDDNNCLDSREAQAYRRRRYACHSCGERFTTHEVVVRKRAERNKTVYISADGRWESP